VLEEYIRERCREKKILLMAHVVVGYPDLQSSLDLVGEIVSAGVDLMELQIPFSEPIADGPVIVKANQAALAAGVRVADCLEFARRVTSSFDIPFLFMTYCNIMYKRGAERFLAEAAEAGIRGTIVADLPPEEADFYLEAADKSNIDPIFILTPTTAPTRLRYLATFGRGFFYCVARKGVTGSKTTFSSEVTDFLSRCREATRLPLAVGFGVSSRADVEFLQGKAEIAVVGTAALRLLESEGAGAVNAFYSKLAGRQASDASSQISTFATR